MPDIDGQCATTQRTYSKVFDDGGDCIGGRAGRLLAFGYDTNRAQVIEAAGIFFFAGRGRQPARLQELGDTGYLKPSILE